MRCLVFRIAYALCLLASSASYGSTISMPTVANVVACDYAYCYVYDFTQPLSGYGVVGDVFETSISFGDTALQLGPVAVARFGGGVSKVIEEGDSRFSISLAIALTGIDGSLVTPFVSILEDVDCHVILSCGIDYQADGPFPEFSDVLAFGALIRLSTSGDPIAVRGGMSAGRAVPLTFISEGALTVPIPEPSTALLMLVGLAGLGWRRDIGLGWRQRREVSGANDGPG